MAAIEGQTFRSEKIIIDGNSYIGCRFHECQLVYTGGVGKIGFSGCVFDRVTWLLEGPARRTIELLRDFCF